MSGEENFRSAPPPAWAQEQLPLFTDRVVRIGELQAAIAEADFTEAASRLERLREEYPNDELPEYAFLELIPSHFWERAASLGDRLALWDSISERLGRNSPRWRHLRNAFFTRLVEGEEPARKLAESFPRAVPDAANALYRSGEPLAARDVVRDALLAGHELRPRDFEDPDVADVLADDLIAPWLACRGAIRQLWRGHPVTQKELAEFERAELGADLEDEHERARLFWRCLCVSGLGWSIPDEIRHKANRCMKKLHDELHAEHMGRYGTIRS